MNHQEVYDECEKVWKEAYGDYSEKFPSHAKKDLEEQLAFHQAMDLEHFNSSPPVKEHYELGFEAYRDIQCTILRNMITKIR